MINMHCRAIIVALLRLRLASLERATAMISCTFVFDERDRGTWKFAFWGAKHNMSTFSHSYATLIWHNFMYGEREICKPIQNPHETDHSQSRKMEWYRRRLLWRSRYTSGWQAKAKMQKLTNFIRLSAFSRIMNFAQFYALSCHLIYELRSIKC